MSSMRDKLLFIRQGGETERFHSLRTVFNETVGHHSFGVAWMIWLITEGKARAELLMAALQHDLAEHKTGDIPAPTKRQLNIRETVSALEDDLLVKAGFRVGGLSPEEDRILHTADVLDGMLACQRERALGNRLVRDCYFNFRQYASDAALHGVAKHIFVAISELWQEVDQ